MIEKYSYRVMWSDEDGEFVGLCSEFPSLSWLSRSQDLAFKGIRQLVSETVLEMEDNKEPIPEPISTKRYSGKFMVRVPPELHKRLALEALESNVSLNRYISATLAAGRSAPRRKH